MISPISEGIVKRLYVTNEVPERQAQKGVLVSVHALRLPVKAQEAEEERDLEEAPCRLHHLRRSQTPGSFQ